MEASIVGKSEDRINEWLLKVSVIFDADAAQIENEYFNGDQNAFFIFTKEAPEGSTYFDHQDDFVDLMSAVRSNEFVAEKPKVHGW